MLLWAHGAEKEKAGGPLARWVAAQAASQGHLDCAVVLCRDVAAIGARVDTRLVGAAVTILHLVRLAAGGEREQLVAEADAEDGLAGLSAVRLQGYSNTRAQRRPEDGAHGHAKSKKKQQEGTCFGRVWTLQIEHDSR